ncbi:hypothetical protein [Streptomyces sp. NPDC051211]|uniref:hypothetical protein n=1 Tax=Streptomyces sp. NPDC051211 TaxID=3154643 RepID=UPI00344E19C5
MRLHRRLRAAGCGLAALGLLAGCSGPESEPEPESSATQGRKFVSVARLCPGLFGAEGGKALERFLESTEFEIRDEKKNVGVQAVVKALENGYKAGKGIRDMPDQICQVSGRPKDGYYRSADLWVDGYSKHVGDPEEFPSLKDRGPRASSSGKQVHLSYDCVSSRAGSTADVPLRIRLMLREQWDGSMGAAVLGPDYLAAVHSAALSIAKELGCAGNGGLPGRPDALPAPDPAAKDGS